jgi:hypothetical protein
MKIKKRIFAFKRYLPNQSVDLLFLPEHEIKKIEAVYSGRNLRFTINGMDIDGSLDELLKKIDYDIVNLTDIKF